MPRKRQIQAKPTRYANVQFASRLEARYAIFFNWLRISWQYEPCTFQYQIRKSVNYYTPDFSIQIGNVTRYIECKPIYPKQDYLRGLRSVFEAYGTFLMVGGFYRGSEPQVFSLPDQNPLLLTLLLHRKYTTITKAVKSASNYRFDI